MKTGGPSRRCLRQLKHWHAALEAALQRVDTRYASRLTDLSLHDCSSALQAWEGSLVSRVAIQNSAGAGTIYGASAEHVHVYFANTGFTTYRSLLRGISMEAVYTAFALSGSSASSLAMSAINATSLGVGFQSAGGNQFNGVGF